MAEVLIFSDLHIHCHKRSTERLFDCLNALEWVFKTAIERKVENIIFLGDLFHDRTKLDIQTLHLTHSIFEKYCAVPDAPNVYLLLGNHDMWSRDKWDIYSPQVVSGWDSVHVIDRPQTLTIGDHPIDFLPFTENPITDLANLRESGVGRILCSHLAIDGAVLNSFGITADVCVEHDGEMRKLDVGYLGHWKRVFLGHYHAAQNLTDTVEYVGSPLQLSFGETGQDKHIVLLDLDTLNVEYIKNTFSRRHVITTPEGIASQNLTDNFVIVKVDNMGGADLADLRKEINTKYKVASLDIRAIPKEEDEALVEEAKAILDSNDKALERWVREKGAGDLEMTTLLEIGVRITESATT